MRKPDSSDDHVADKYATPAGSQTLLRGLDLLDEISQRPGSLSELSRRLNLNRSTVHRLASALVDRGHLRLVPGEGYMLGPKLLELGFAARQQIDLARIARPHLERLSELTEDTVHLGVLDGDKALYLDKLSGNRRVEIGSRVGERHPLCSTGLGKSLLLDGNPTGLREQYERELGAGSAKGDAFKTWQEGMQRYASGGFSFDLEENEDRIRCVGAPVRDEMGAIVGAISVSSVAQYMADERMEELSAIVKETAQQISRELGWNGHRERAVAR
jgi:DNA-binding IclR family transcriptional regulator